MPEITTEPITSTASTAVAPDGTPLVQQPPMSVSQAKQVTSSLGIDPNAVLSSANVQQTINQPTPAPDDLLGIRKQLYGELGVTGAQTAFDTAQKAYMDRQALLQQDLTNLGGRTVSMSKIVGQQGQAQQVAQNDITNLQNAAVIAQNKLLSAKTEAEAQFAIREKQIVQTQTMMYQYPGANIKYGDSSEKIASKLSKYQEQVKDDAYKQTLKQTAMSLGVKTSGSIKDLEKRISASSEQALADAKAERDLKMEGMRMDIANTKSTIADRNAGGVNTGDVNAYAEAYSSGQITAAGIPQKIRDDVLKIAAPVIKQNNQSKLSGDISQFLSNADNAKSSYDQLFKISKANYPTLSDSEIDQIAKPQYETIHPQKSWWEFWK
jgi:hypothetical protein